jgi:hypothetical protein
MGCRPHIDKESKWLPAPKDADVYLVDERSVAP